MSFNAFFIAAIENMKVKEELGRGDKIGEDIFISNNHNIIMENTMPAFASTIGMLEFDHLLSGNLFAYAFNNIEYTNHKLHRDMVIYYLRKIQNFLDSLWLSYDNSVDFNLGFLLVTEKDKIPVISSNNLAILYSNSKGLTGELCISREDLREIRLNRLNIWGNQMDFQTYMSQGLHDISQINRKLFQFRIEDRLSRCLSLTSAARSETLIPLKITQYCICFESLFSTDNEGLSFKVSERVAHFLHSEGFNKLEVFNDLKQAYKIRSSIVHGDILPRNISEADLLSEKCDSYLRKAIHKIFNDASLMELFRSEKRELLNNYFLRQCLQIS
jgi:hypothetical protein